MQKILYLSILAFLFVTISDSCKQAPKKEDAYDKAIKAEDDLLNTKEFKDYYNSFFNLSDNNTKTDLPYVNKFMSDNKLWKFKNVCDLLENEKVKNNKRIFDYWTKRCDFQKARTILMEKYKLDSDSLKILMEHAVSMQQAPPEK